MSEDFEEPAPPPAKRRWRRIVAMAGLAAGAALIAATFNDGQKEPVAIHVSLPRSIRELRMEIHREQKLMEHLEWVYGGATAPTAGNTTAAAPPLAQDANLELPPGEYTVSVEASGATTVPAALELRVVKGEVARLALTVR